MLSLVDGVPSVLNLKQMIEEFIRHRKDVVTKRTEFDLKKAKERAHILEGIIKALDHIDEVIRTIKASQTVEIAKKNLMSKFGLTEIQSQAILDMRLQKLASLEQQKMREEHSDILKLISMLQDILAHDEKIYGIIKEEMAELKKKYGDDRRTEIIDSGECIEDLEDERLIKEEDVVITFSNDDYVKRIPLEEYKQQKRGGKGIIGTRTKEGDIVKEMYITSTHDYLLCFTDKGKVFWLKAYKIPEASRYGKGRPIINLLDVEKDEKVKDIIPIKEFEEGKYIFFVTRKGQVKKTPLMAYSRPRSCGIKAIELREGDDLVEAKPTDGTREIIIATKKGFAIRFRESDVRSMGRVASGVRGIRLRKGDHVMGICRVESDSSLFTVTVKGYGKRTQFDEYRIQTRGGKGVTNLRVTPKNGEVVGIAPLHDDDEVMFISREGMIIRAPAKDISEIGRATQGVRVMRLNKGDELVSFARIEQEDE
jgi:DNA gyrase subunit A